MAEACVMVVRRHDHQPPGTVFQPALHVFGPVVHQEGSVHHALVVGDGDAVDIVPQVAGAPLDLLGPSGVFPRRGLGEDGDGVADLLGNLQDVPAKFEFGEVAEPTALGGDDVAPSLEVGDVLVEDRLRFMGGGDPPQVLQELAVIVCQGAVQVEEGDLGALHGLPRRSGVSRLTLS